MALQFCSLSTKILLAFVYYVFVLPSHLLELIPKLHSLTLSCFIGQFALAAQELNLFLEFLMFEHFKVQAFVALQLNLFLPRSQFLNLQGYLLKLLLLLLELGLRFPQFRLKTLLLA